MEIGNFIGGRIGVCNTDDTVGSKGQLNSYQLVKFTDFN